MNTTPTKAELPERLDYGHTIAGRQEDWPIVDEHGRTWAISLGERMAKELVRRYNAHEEMVKACQDALAMIDEFDRKTPWQEVEPQWWLDMMKRADRLRAATHHP